MAGQIEEPFSLSFQADSIHSGSISFGRFEGEQLCWERRSSFSHNRYLEEVEKYSIPGSVTEKKAYFEARFRKKALLSQASSECQNSSLEYQCSEYDTFENISCGEEQELNKEGRYPIHEMKPIDKHNHLADDANIINKGSHSSIFDGSHSSIFDKSSEGSDLDDDCIVMEWFRESIVTPTTEFVKEHTRLRIDEIIEPVHEPIDVPLAITENVIEECEEPDSEEKCISEKTMIHDATSKAMQMEPNRCTTEENDTGSLDHQKLASKVKAKMEPKSMKSKPKSLVNLVCVQRRLAVEPTKETAKKPNGNGQKGIQNALPEKQFLNKSKVNHKSSETKVTNHDKSADKRLKTKTVAASTSKVMNKTPHNADRTKQVFDPKKPVVKQSDATLGTHERAERRKKLYPKLEHEKVATNQIQEKSKKKEADIKQFKATPMPSFYHGSGKKWFIHE
ncbi:protein WVD2-like 7 isoform X2 [Impatiens glandulifera]|uniref:protein WVD2-like 7 isoform X2 n=1 Tax=Impatiens glandulifera TaxID=253017 RepID=UPI001FB10937|nr:protein WVD2-like 7 isoform X2 [Impatiens glandulifera]